MCSLQATCGDALNNRDAALNVDLTVEMEEGLSGKHELVGSRALYKGSFAFLWGQKQEYTSTWYALFMDSGLPTEAIDVLQFCWSGSYPENKSPKNQDGGKERVDSHFLAHTHSPDCPQSGKMKEER